MQIQNITHFTEIGEKLRSDILFIIAVQTGNCCFFLLRVLKNSSHESFVAKVTFIADLRTPLGRI